MKSYSSFKTYLHETLDDWTHKLHYNDLTPEMQNQVKEKHKSAKNVPAVGDKYLYHFNITSPPKGYVGHLPYGVYSHRSIRDTSADKFSKKISDHNMTFKQKNV